MRKNYCCPVATVLSYPFHSQNSSHDLEEFKSALSFNKGVSRMMVDLGSSHWIEILDMNHKLN